MSAQKAVCNRIPNVTPLSNGFRFSFVSNFLVYCFVKKSMNMYPMPIVIALRINSRSVTEMEML